MKEVNIRVGDSGSCIVKIGTVQGEIKGKSK